MSQGSIVLLSLIFCIFITWLNSYIAEQFYEAAEAKGYHSRKYFWLSFLFGCVGYLLVIALPDRGNTPQVISDELPDL